MPGKKGGETPETGGAPRARRFVATKTEVEGREETKIVQLPDRDPEVWREDATLHVVGQRVPRMDALEKVSGRARYTADIQRPGMLHTAIVRAPVAAGRVRDMDLAPALAIAGVRGSLTAHEVPGIECRSGALFDASIGYAGQPLCAICADSAETAEAGAAAVRLSIDPAPHAVTAALALADGAPQVRPSGNRSKNSPRIAQRGDPDAALRSADVVISRQYRTPVAVHTALEPHGGVAEWEGDHVTVWESTQGIFHTRRDVARAFGLKLSKVRVLTDFMGGGFGAKNGAATGTYIAVALARKLGRPVRCMFDREGEQIDAGNRPASIQNVTLGATRDGTLTAIVMDAIIPLGIAGWQSSASAIYRELYSCNNVRTSETFVYINAGAMAAFRGPGHTEGAFGLECAMNALARELNMDPVALRMRNYASADPHRGRPYSSKKLDECYARGAERFGWKNAEDGSRKPEGAQPDGGRQKVETQPGTPALSSPFPPSSTLPRLRRGRGMSSVTWPAGGGPPAYATVRINGDGTIEALTGAQDLGTGSRTVMAQIAAEVLGARIEDVRTVLGDTERLPFASNSWGSITTASVGPAVRVAAEEARERLLEAAAEMLDTEPRCLVTRDSVIHMIGTDKTITFKAVCEALGDVMIMGQGSRGPNPDNTAIASFAAHFAEVEVDSDTGQVRVLRIVAAHDSGRIINPTLAESQLEGGILQGMGYALFEERVMDAQLGLVLNPTMHDYKIPTMADVPRIDAFFVSGSDTIANHTGARGLAEPPMIGVAPAIASAVADAIGVEVLEIPLTPWRVLAALKSQSSTS